MEKIRTITQIIEIVKKEDPDTALTEWALRQLVSRGEIPSIKSGNKYLVSLEAVEEYLRKTLR